MAPGANVRRKLLIIPYLLWGIFFLLLPFALLISTSFFTRDEHGVIVTNFSSAAYRELFSPLNAQILARTFFLAIFNTLACLILAFPFAFYLSRLPKSAAKRWLTWVMIPFWTNFLLRLLGFMDFLRLLKVIGLDLNYSYPGLLLAMVYNYMPFALLPLYASLEKISDSTIEAALDLGSSKRKVLLHIVLPLAHKGILAASVLVFIPSLGEFLIPEIAGGGRSFFLGNFLQQQFLVARNWPLGSAAVSLLLLLALFLLLFSYREKEA